MKKMMKYFVRMAVPILVLACCAFNANALDKSYYAESSKLATGKWVKISVRESGIYQITADDIRSWGLGSDLSQIHVFGYGGAPLSEMMSGDNYADDLPQTPIVRTGDRILFYAQGPVTWRTSTSLDQMQVQHPYAITGSYLVTNDPQFSDIEIAKATNEPTGNIETTYTARLFHEQELINSGETGRKFLGESFSSTKTQNFTFDLDGLVSGSEVKVATMFGAKTVGGKSNLTLTTNNDNVNTLVIDSVLNVQSHIHYKLKQLITTVTLDEGKTTLDHSIDYSCKGTVYLARLDYITVNYERQLALKNGSLLFALSKASSGTRYRMSNCGSTTRVWDVTKPFALVQLNTEAGDGGTLTFSSASSGYREFVAFDESGTYSHPEFMGEVSNQNIHGELTPDMIILAPGAYLEQAQRVA